MLIFCKWYTIIFLIFGMLITIAKDGESATNYTGKLKITALILHIPVFYYLFNI